jgi:hypothetical protein
VLTFIVKQLLDSGSLQGALAAAHPRLCDFDQVTAAKGSHLNMPAEAQYPFAHGAFEDQVRVAVSCQDLGYRALETVLRAPLRRAGVGLDKAAFLIRVTAMEVSVVEAALFTGGSTHYSCS